MTLESHETPSHETLPIISKEYFPYSVKDFSTEVDNTSPSAVYHANTVSKVDVVFAIGELSQMDNLESYMPTFEARLNAAANNFDTQITSVETVTGGFDMADVDAATIFNTWEQYPNPNSFELTPDGKYIKNHGGNEDGYAIVLGGVRYKSNGRGGFQQAFIDPKSNSDGKLKLTAWIAPHPECGCGGGIIFRWNKETDEAYMLTTGEMSRNNVILTKVSNVSKKWGNLDGTSIAVVGAICGGQNLAELRGVGGTGTYTIEVDEDNNITVSKNGNQLIKCKDTEPITSGYCGLWAGCTIGITDVAFSYETTVRKTLGESLLDVSWRDGAVRFVVHATDIVPEECLPGNEKDFAYTVTKLLNANCYLINLGNGVNSSQLARLVAAIRQADGREKGTYYYNSPIYTAMNKSADYIIEIAKNLSKPTDWVLVNTEIKWDTEYNDNEKDLPLNFGEHDGSKKQPQDKSDITLANTWNKALTHYYTEDKVLSEKWRYRHKPDFYDNSSVQVGYHTIWLPDPVEVFEYTGKYRINYKRRDNPVYPDAKLSNYFDDYRYWSTNYDRLSSIED